MSTPLPPVKANLSLVETVLRVRDTIPGFNRNVGGSSEFLEELIANERIARPYCWVVPMAEFGDDINQEEGTQVRHVVMAFIVCVNNTMQKGSGLGNEAPRVHDSIQTLQDALEESLLKWEPTSIKLDDPPTWRARTLLGMDNVECHYQIEFEFSYVKFDPYYLPKLIREAVLAEANGELTSAHQIKQIAARYNVEEGVIVKSLDDGYFGMPDEGTAPTPEEEAAALAQADLLDVEDKTNTEEIELADTGTRPAGGVMERHGIETKVEQS